jgi:hypothetical protein
VIADNQSQGVGSAANKTARHTVWQVVETFRHRKDAIPRFRMYIALLVQATRNRGHVKTRLASNVLDRIALSQSFVIVARSGPLRNCKARSTEPCQGQVEMS